MIIILPFLYFCNDFFNLNYSRELVNEYAASWYSPSNREKRSIYLPLLANVNICMSKKVYNKYKKTLECVTD